MRIHAVTLDQQGKNQQLEQWAHVSHIVDRLHLRFPNKNAADVYRITDELLKRGAKRDRLVVHDRLDIALLLDVPTVQLGYRSPPVAVVRRRFPQLTLGVSVHSVHEAVQASQQGADYVLYGHVFETASKAGLPPQGLASLQEVVRRVPIPVVAIGGITPERLADVAKTGAQGVAVQSGIFQAEDPLQAAKKFQQKMLSSSVDDLDS